MPEWTVEQILSLAPDTASARAGKELASPRRWLRVGANAALAWGECQGSAKEPYQAQIDLAEPAFKCSCPSHKFPCKHALGLFLLLADQPALFAETTPPAWVLEWQAKRAQAAQKSARRKEESAEPSAAAPARAADAARRAARREERVRQGLDDLDLWLSDLLRQGLGAAQAQPRSFWENPAARLVDAQAAGLARRVRELGAIAASAGEGWQGRLLARAADLSLLVAGYRRLETLPPPAQAEIRAQAGWTQDQEELLKQDGVSDRWLVMAKRVEEDTATPPGRAALRVRRTWLWGLDTRRAALILDFAAPGQYFEGALAPGAGLEAELVFFAGSYPLRALLKKSAKALTTIPRPQGHATLEEALHAYASALGANPWLDAFPVLLNGVLPSRAGETWGVSDAQGGFLPCAARFQQAWTLLALSGGAPLDLFCEWDGEALLPLSALADGRLVQLEPGQGEG